MNNKEHPMKINPIVLEICKIMILTKKFLIYDKISDVISQPTQSRKFSKKKNQVCLNRLEMLWNA